MSESAPTFRRIVSTFTDFLTVAIHTILYERSIYPRTSFLSAKKYNFPVRQNRHPKVCDWINDAVSAAEAEMLKGVVQCIALVLHTNEGPVIERYVFDVSRFPAINPMDVDTPIERIGPDGEPVAILPLVDLEEQLRATMSRLASCGSKLSSLPDGCTFTVAIELKQEGQAPLGHPQPWVPVQHDAERHDYDVSSTTMVRPIRSVTAGEVMFETWLEVAQSR